MESIHNKYGSIIVETTELGDLSFDVLDENGAMPKNRKEARELAKQQAEEAKKES